MVHISISVQNENPSSNKQPGHNTSPGTNDNETKQKKNIQKDKKVHREISNKKLYICCLVSFVILVPAMIFLIIDDFSLILVAFVLVLGAPLMILFIVIIKCILIDGAFARPKFTDLSTNFLKNKIVVITGGTSGIGKEIALSLLEKGMTVVITGRNYQKIKCGVFIDKEKWNNKINFIACDFSTFASVKTCADQISKKYKRIDVQINNIGSYKRQKETTIDNNDYLTQVNYFSMFYFTSLVQPLLIKSKRSKIINVTSYMHKGTCKYKSIFHLDDLNITNREYKNVNAYCDSKLYVLAFTKGLCEFIKQNEIYKFVKCCSINPGPTNTKLYRERSCMVRFLRQVCYPFWWLWYLWPIHGAKICVYLACEKWDDLISGKYYVSLYCRNDSNVSKEIDNQKVVELWNNTIDLVNAALLKFDRKCKGVGCFKRFRDNTVNMMNLEDEKMLKLMNDDKIHKKMALGDDKKEVDPVKQDGLVVTKASTHDVENSENKFNQTIFGNFRDHDYQAEPEPQVDEPDKKFQAILLPNRNSCMNEIKFGMFGGGLGGYEPEQKDTQGYGDNDDGIQEEKSYSYSNCEDYDEIQEKKQSSYHIEESQSVNSESSNNTNNKQDTSIVRSSNFTIQKSLNQESQIKSTSHCDENQSNIDNKNVGPGQRQKPQVPLQNKDKEKSIWEFRDVGKNSIECHTHYPFYEARTKVIKMKNSKTTESNMKNQLKNNLQPDSNGK